MAKRSFPTKTLWSIMDPVSQQAAQLVILHDEACSGLTLPDLTEPVNGVQAAVQNLLNVCDSLLTTSKDEVLQREMTAACAAVREATSGLLGAAALLRADGRSEPGRRELGRHVHGLLSGMAELLFAWDDSEVRHSVNACTALLEYMCANAKHVVNEVNLRAFETSVSSSLSALLKRVRTRAQDLIAPRRAALLERASSRLDGLWLHLAAALATFEDTEHRELLLSAFVALGHELINALLAVDLEFDALRSREQQLRSDQQLVRDRAPAALAWSRVRAHSGSPELAGEQLAVWDVLRAARRIACLHGSSGQKLMDLVDDAERLVCARLLGKEEDVNELEKKLQEILTACEAELEASEGEDEAEEPKDEKAEVMREVERCLCGESEEDTLQKIEDVCADSSLSTEERRSRLEGLCAELEERSRRMGRAAEHLAIADAARDIRERRLATAQTDQMLRTALQLRREARTVRTAALCGAPVTASAAEWRRCAQEVRQMARKAGGADLMVAVETAASAAAKEAESAAKEGRKEEGKLQVCRVAHLAQWAVSCAEQEAEESEQPTLRAEVAALIASNDLATEPLIATGTVMIDGGGEKKATDEWRNLSSTTVDAMTRLRTTLTSDAPAHQEIPAASAKPLEHAAEVVEDPKFDFPEAKEEDKIMNAAHKLHSEASYWDSEGNSLVAAAKRAAFHLATLHDAAQSESGNKKVLIETSRALLGETAHIVKEAKRIAAACTDKRLATALLDLVTRLTTHNQQLKVVTAVKAAASGANDAATESDAYEQLSTNAEIIMRGVVDILRLAEAASIKIRVDSGLVLQWKRRT